MRSSVPSTTQRSCRNGGRASLSVSRGCLRERRRLVLPRLRELERGLERRARPDRGDGMIRRMNDIDYAVDAFIGECARRGLSKATRTKYQDVLFKLCA